MTHELVAKLAACYVGVTKEHLERMRGDLAELRLVCRQRLVVADYLFAQPAIEGFQLLISVTESRLERQANG